MTKISLEVQADDESDRVTFDENELNALQLVCLLQSVEDIRDIIKDPDNRDDIDRDEITDNYRFQTGNN